MAEEPIEDQTPENAPVQEPVLEGGSYEIIRGRLKAQADGLSARLEKLNELRKEVFGAIETALLRAERITTEHNCVPRDMVPIGGRKFLFGYNVHFGLKSSIQLSDVFSLYDYRDGGFHPAGLNVLEQGTFAEDFKSLYKYYKNTKFVKFSFIGPYLFMVFRVGQQVGDVKTFKWLIKDGTIHYIDNRSDHEFSFPHQYECEWIRTHRDLHRSGEFPHISIDERVFVSCTDGRIRIKVEDNTDSGMGVYSEDVQHKDQTLDDAEIFYAVLGNLILIKIKPFQEKKPRFFVFNDKLNSVHRIDALEHSCVLLPEDQGIIFADGYYLQTGELKRFETEKTEMMFERQVRSPNGEDFLYVFYNRMEGDYILMSYNLIAQGVENPILCNGFSLFDNGELAYFKAEGEPSKHHTIQIWQTPFITTGMEAHEKTDSFLYKIGNKDVVRCMAECGEVINLINKPDSYANLYVDLVKKSGDIAESYFWVDQEQAFNLRECLLSIREAAGKAVDEFDKVRRIRKETLNAVEAAQSKTKGLLRDIAKSELKSIEEFVQQLAGLRTLRGEITGLKDLRYVDHFLVKSLETEVGEKNARLSERCVEFLLKPAALDPYRHKIEEHRKQVPELAKAAEAKKLEEAIAQAGSELEMLIEIVSNLKIEDATETTRIIDNITSIYSTLNQVKAALKKKARELMSVEGKAQFNAQIKLLSQSIVNYLDICDSPEKCDEYLNKLTVHLEELEGRFSDFDEFTVQLADKRAEIYESFEARKLNLIEARNRKANALMTSAERILKVIQNRVAGMKALNDINGYFASDLMIEKVRDVIRQLVGLGDSVKSDDLQGRLKTIQQDAVRQLKDKLELFVDGANVIRLGAHAFSVNTQPLDLTLVKRGEDMCLHLTGTKYFEPIREEPFLETKAVWDQETVSENSDVYRGEYLAYQMTRSLLHGENGLALIDYEKAGAEQRVQYVRDFMSSRYAESYQKGIHDRDGEAILSALLKLRSELGLVRYPPPARACALVFWKRFCPAQTKSLWAAKLEGFGAKNRFFPGDPLHDGYIQALGDLLRRFVQEERLFAEEDAGLAGEYLFYELTSEGDFAISREAAEWLKAFNADLKEKRCEEDFAKAREAVGDHPRSEFELIRDWVRGYLKGLDSDSPRRHLDETAALLFCYDPDPRWVVQADASVVLKDMAGAHARIQGNDYRLDYLEFQSRLARFERTQVVMFNRYHELKQQIVERARESMRLNEFEPRVLTSFVRNQLIDKVLLPMIGDNLAKQVGAEGDKKRTDLMGLLLLISPPGYGKTTLMEYTANRLGITFVKINGPALGHHVTSLDPEEAPNAAAREEVKKLNFSLELGDNVMIYVDDIQHCNPEFLQKFISLCDAQRRIEGVWNGKPRTYDLRGRKVAVVMAGNPYTESGEKFRIPDMLANRADTYNLGDILGGQAGAFKSSYLENAVTSNPVLQQLANKSQKDIQAFIRVAETGSRDGVDFESDYSVADVNEIVDVMGKLVRVRDLILRVNQEYIRSAGQADEYRTEPPFRLQGSYRNMNRLAEKVLALLNEAELNQLILDHYENESQTLTTGAEANFLKFKEINGLLNETEAARWAEIKKTFQRHQIMGRGDPSDPVGRVVAQLTHFNEGLGSIRESLDQNLNRLLESKPDKPIQLDLQPVVGQLSALGDQLRGLREREAKTVEEVTPSRDSRPNEEWTRHWGEFVNGLKSIHEVLAQGVQKASETSAKVDGIESVADELRLLGKDMKLIKAILDKYEESKTVKAEMAETDREGEEVDLSGITITRETLDRIYRLIEKDEKYKTGNAAKPKKAAKKKAG